MAARRWNVRVRILGPVELTDATGDLVPLGGARLRALLIRLAIDAGRSVSAERLAEDLWPRERPADVTNALQALVSRLRQAAGKDMIGYRSGGYRLDLDPGEIDACVFERRVSTGRAAAASGETARGAALLREALALWRGDALADAGDWPFAAGPASRLEEARLAAIEDAVDAELRLGRGPELVAEVTELAAANPLRERLCGLLMRALYASGRQADALQTYEDIRHTLAERLGVDPSPPLAAVHLAILRGEADAADRGRVSAASGAGAEPEGAQPEPAVGRPAGNLPARLTSFVGRDEELRSLGKQLGEARLVTLTGPGGAGKTRLAIEAAVRLADQVRDGAWFVPLAPVRDALDVPQAVLAEVGVSEPMWVEAVYAPPLDRLTDAVAGRQLLLVLDNCEHVIDEVAKLAELVLAAAPGVRIIATSREPLAVTGETLCPVPALALPPDGAAAADAMGYAAVRLLADRAVAVRPGFAVDAGNAADVVRICRALDGMPLAIELAAARLRVLTPAQVAERLDDRFRLLAMGSRSSLPRHQTLRAVVDWSWDLLDLTERLVLRRLSVFSGGATPEAAEQVCAFDGRPVAGIIDVIASLVDKSLVTAAGDREVRYGLLETVRAYAAERLAEAGEQEAVADAHAGYFLRLAERAEPLLRTGDQVPWMVRLAAEHDNCSAALRHAIDTRDAALGLRLVAALMWFWVLRDYDAEAAQWAGEVARIAGDDVPPDLADAYALCRILTLMGSMGKGAREQSAADPDLAASGDDPERLAAQIQGVIALVPADSRHPMLKLVGPISALFTGDELAARRSLADLADQGDPWLQALATALAGHLAMACGDVDTAASSLSAAQAGFSEIGDRWGLVMTMAGLAEVALARDDPAEAVATLVAARGYAADGLSANWSEMMLVALGKARAAQGDLDAARADLERGIDYAARFGGRDDQVNGYLELSEVARRSDDMPDARRLLEQALEVAESKSVRPDMVFVAARTFGKLGCLAEQEGDLQAAAAWHRRAVRTLADAKMPFPVNTVLAELVAGFAALAGADGDHVRAAELLGLAHSLRGFRDAGSLEEARATAAATAAIGAGEFAAAYQRGRHLSREDALALAR
jgi:predicted ATPase/DNA-binding SARP family transcriptional activator